MRATPALASLALLLATSEAAGHEPRGQERSADGFGPLSFAYTALPIALGATRFVEIDDVNETLREAGFGEVSTITPTVGASLVVAYPVGLVLEPMYRFTIASTSEVSLSSHQLFLNGGWLIHARGDVVAFPLVGVGYGNSSLELTLPEVPEQRFGELLAEPSGEALLSSSSLLLQVGLSASLWGSGAGDFVGLRSGLMWAPISSGWKRRGHAVDGGPAPPMSGAYLSLLLGFHSVRRGR
jgi:hypothetical protein